MRLFKKLINDDSLLYILLFIYFSLSLTRIDLYTGLLLLYININKPLFLSWGRKRKISSMLLPVTLRIFLAI